MGPLKQGITTVADFTPWPIEKSKVQNKHDSAATKISEDTNFGIVEKIKAFLETDGGPSLADGESPPMGPIGIQRHIHDTCTWHSPTAC